MLAGKFAGVLGAYGEIEISSCPHFLAITGKNLNGKKLTAKNLTKTPGLAETGGNGDKGGLSLILLLIGCGSVSSVDSC